MVKEEKPVEKRSFIDWKMVRIPRSIFRILLFSIVALALVSLLTYAVKFQADRFPLLAKIGSFLGIESREKDAKEDRKSEEDGVMETHFARLVYVKGDVTVKSKKELRYLKAEEGQILKEGDSIRTFSGGYAEVRFDEGNRLNIKPDSLVVIRVMTENRLTKIRKSSIKLRQSDVEAIIRRPEVEGSEFVIETPTALAKIAEAKVAVQVSEGNESKLKVYKGTVNLEVGNEAVEVVKNQSVDISRESKIGNIKDLPPPPVLLHPENLAEFYFRNLNEMQAILKWNPVTQVDVKYRLQSALDPYFSDLVIVRMGLSREGVVVQGLKSGIYYWRVSSVTSEGLEGDFSDYRVFKVTIDKTPPEIILDDVLLLRVSGKTNAQISGQTEPDASLTINGDSVTPDKTGRFKYVLSEVPSSAEIIITAEDRVGNRSVLKKKIQVQ
jgi:hypothetical protein